jgi:hypothetical protein
MHSSTTKLKPAKAQFMTLCLTDSFFAVPPLMLKTAANPGGVFDQLRAFAALGMATVVMLGSEEGWAAETCVVPQFASARMFPAGINPVASVVGDFNRDGIPDLAVASQEGTATDTNGNVWVLVSNGDGSFRASKSYAVGFRPSSIAAADLNRDGKLDLVVANMSTSGVSVLFGNGDGSFQASVEYSYGGQPVTVACGDLNLDGNVDVVLANYGTNTLSILFGNGDGTLQPAQNLQLSESPQAIIIADFNKDGKPDLAISTTSHSLFLLLGNGNGSFKDPVNITPPPPFDIACYSLGAGDFNRDGNVDLVASWDNVVLLLSRGDGTFEPRPVGSLPAYQSPLVVADFDGDGNLDVATSDGAVYLAYGNGDGTFRDKIESLVIGPGPSSLFVGDFNSDGKVDLGATDYGALGPDGGVSLVLGSGGGLFRGMQTIKWAAENSIAVGDVNGDGKLDIIGQAAGLSVTLGNGDGSFQTTVSWCCYPIGPIALGDLNKDGLLDLVVADQQSTNIEFFSGRGDGTFIWPPQSQSVGSGPIAVAIGDLNLDGAPDVVVANNGSSSVSVLLNKGDGTFNDHNDYIVGGFPNSVAIGDINSDGFLDILVPHPSHGSLSPAGISILIGLGDGTFSPATNITAGPSPYALTLADLNHDGNVDIVVANSLGSLPSDEDSVTVVLGNGDGTFKAPVQYLVGATPYSIAVADFNGDGVPDIAVANYASDDISILLGQGDGTFGPLVNFFSGINPVYYEPLSPFSLAVGDFNGDGKPDLVLSNVDSKSAAVLLNTCTSRPPLLNVTRRGSAIVLSWPVQSAAFALEFTSSLELPDWQLVSQAPTTNATRLEIMLPIDAGNSYFRLHQR